jgi:hypothetical protein
MNAIADRAGSASRTLAPRRSPAPSAASELSDGLLAARRRTATAVALLSLAALTGLFVALILVSDRGHFTYVLDDPYIHLSMARNLAQHASFGVVPGVYESASSSPGWVALLASLIKVAPGSAEWLPLALNLLAAAAVLTVIIRSQRFLFVPESALVRGVAYAVLPAAIFLPGLVLVGMEHSLHALLTVLMLLMLDRALRRPLTRAELAGTAVVALLAGAVRYETLFLAGSAALTLLVMPHAPGGEAVRGRLRRAAARARRIEVWAFLLPPLVVTAVLAAINLHNGEYALPNSVLAKSGLGAGHGLVGWVPTLNGIAQTLQDDLLADALLGAGLLYLALKRLQGETSGLWLAWTVMAALHIGYAKFGWFDRYQGYLVVSGMWLALRSLPDFRRVSAARAALIALVLLVALPMFKFTRQAEVVRSAQLIYQHQAPMGAFLAAEYAGTTVMVNDIGEVSWQHQGGLDDIWALGSYRVLRAYRTGQMGPDFVQRLAGEDHVQVVAIWSALSGYIPPAFVEVARWSTSGTGRPDPQNDLVFYAPSQSQAAVLRQRMLSYSGRLPSGIDVLWSAQAS